MKLRNDSSLHRGIKASMSDVSAAAGIVRSTSMSMSPLSATM